MIPDSIETSNEICINSIQHFQIQNQHYLGCVGDSKYLELWKTKYDNDLNLKISKPINIQGGFQQSFILILIDLMLLYIYHSTTIVSLLIAIISKFVT